MGRGEDQAVMLPVLSKAFCSQGRGESEGTGGWSDSGGGGSGPEIRATWDGGFDPDSKGRAPGCRWGRGSRGRPRGAAEWDTATLCPAGLRQQAPTLADHLEKRGVEAGQVHKGVRSVSVPAPGECGDLSLAGDVTEWVWA